MMMTLFWMTWYATDCCYCHTANLAISVKLKSLCVFVVAYTTFYILGLLCSMQVPFVGMQPIRTSEHMASAGWLIDWLSCGFTSHFNLTQNRSFQRRFPKPVSWLGIEKTIPNTTKACIHQAKEMYYNTKWTKNKSQVKSPFTTSA